MIKAILFDANGVVVNKHKLWSEHFAEDYSLDPALVQPFFQNEFQACLVGRADLKEVIKHYLSKWGWSGSVDELLDYWFRVQSTVDERLVEHIQHYRTSNLPCYLATNQEKYRVEYMRSTMGLGKKFDGIFASANLGAKKSEPEFWQAVTAQIPSAQRDEVLLWDDEQANVDSAKRFGFQAELYISREDFVGKMKTYGIAN